MIPQRHHFDRHAHAIIKSLAGGDPNDAFSCEDLGLILRVSTAWLSLARASKYGPKFEEHNGEYFYRRGKLINYLKQRQEVFEATPTALVIAPRPTWPAAKKPKQPPTKQAQIAAE